jgi:hypothetical protein
MLHDLKYNYGKYPSVNTWFLLLQLFGMANGLILPKTIPLSDYFIMIIRYYKFTAFLLLLLVTTSHTI